MARINNLKNFITDVASAIKTKLEINTSITPSNFDTLINSIPSGTDISDTTATINDVLEGKIFYGADGSRLIGIAVEAPITPNDYNQALNQIANLFGEDNN